MVTHTLDQSVTGSETPSARNELAAVFQITVSAMHYFTVLTDSDPQGSALEWLAERYVDEASVVNSPSVRVLRNVVDKAPGKSVISDTPFGHEGSGVRYTSSLQRQHRLRGTRSISYLCCGI